MTHTAHTVQDPNVDTIRQQLEQQLEERLDLLAELAPRALPSVDPVAYQTVASTRMVVEQITAALNRLRCRHLRPLHPLRRPDRSRTTRSPALRCRLHRMSKPCRRRITPGIPRRIDASRTGPGLGLGPATMTAAAQSSELTNAPCRRSSSTVGWTTEVPTHLGHVRSRRALRVEPHSPRNRLRVRRRRRRRSRLSPPPPRDEDDAARIVQRLAPIAPPKVVRRRFGAAHPECDEGVTETRLT